jgi:hypothetical protein
VIALTITDFLMFPEIDPVITRFILKEKDYGSSRIAVEPFYI